MWSDTAGIILIFVITYNKYLVLTDTDDSFRGVVQLFNAVQQHQKTVSSEIDKAGNLEYKKDRILKSVSKKDFLNVLMGSAKSHSVTELMETQTNVSQIYNFFYVTKHHSQFFISNWV